MADDFSGGPGYLESLLMQQQGLARQPLQIDPTRQQFLQQSGGPAPVVKGNLVKADDGTRVNIAPKDMQVPEWGKGLTWGLTAYRYNKGIPALMVRDARLPPDATSKGAGIAMYQEAATTAFNEGRRFQSDGTVTEAGVRMWAALKRRGYDVQTASNHKFVPGPQDAPHLSRYETTDGSPMFWINPPER